MSLTRFRLGFDKGRGICCWLCLVVIGLSALHSPVHAQVSAQDLLRGGLDALVDQQPTEARAHFEKLLQTFPRSPEAVRAAKELHRLDDGDADTSDVDAADADADADGVSADSGSGGGSDQAMGSGRSGNNPAASATSAGRRLNTPTLRARRAFVTAVGDRVFFAENSAGLGGRARAMLESMGRWLAKHPTLTMTLIGRADDGGSATAAQELSLQRAEAVRAKFVEVGVPASAISVEARGATDPVATCLSALCQAQNRQVEALISVPAGPAGEAATFSSVSPPVGPGTAVSAQERDGTLAR